MNLIVVHPHGRGEKRRAPVTTGARSGSPPRAWGKAKILTKITDIFRFTPTGVGKSSGSSVLRAPEVVHPHGRGEK